MEWLLEIPLWFRLTGTFVLGTIVGSFLNVCILRLPWDKSVFWPGSRCPSCEKPIAWYDNVPIVSWLVLWGKCRNCRTWISPRYAAIELLTGLLFALLYWMEVQPHDQWVRGGPTPTSANLHWRYLYHLALLSAMIVATFIDLDYQVIPDSVTVPGMILGLTLGFAVGQVHLIPAWIVPYAFTGATPYIPLWFGAHPHWHGLIASGAGFVVGGGVVWLVRIIGGFVLGKEAMGFGDVTLMAMIGSFIGWQAALLVFFLAPFVGMVVAIVQWLSRGDNLIPYGPYLSLATLGVLLAWVPIWNRISPVFGMGLLVPIVVLICVSMLGVLLLAWRLLWWAAGVVVGRSRGDDEGEEGEGGEDPTDPLPELGPSAGVGAELSRQAPDSPIASPLQDAVDQPDSTAPGPSLKNAGSGENGKPVTRWQRRSVSPKHPAFSGRRAEVRNRRNSKTLRCSTGRCWCFQQAVAHAGNLPHKTQIHRTSA